ncbi:hypothetical protein ALC57_02690 [Trachymyrmex cornetzi]|uniref:Reverse transcriptase/retrotransposon-derived protein RNase H-like domain-containing protein n=1 Tax=Trachymyrmex cornetzi TaxID=471704 RepID=A0A151JN30_9HYME|nr:hypothetical protein ALC57_02690 [Trachymyrmex cornetzi]
MPIAWTPLAERAVEASRESLAQAALLAHPKSDAEVALFADASDHSIRASLQQKKARKLIIYTDHKPLTFAFRQKPEKSTPRQFRHLDFVGQFTTDIRHVSGGENVVADALSRVEELQSPMDYVALAAAQQNDEEVKKYIQ